MSPPVDLELSWSKVLDNPQLPGRHAKAALAARQMLERATALRTSVSQPFDHSDGWTGHSSPYVALEAALSELEIVLSAGA